MTAAPPPSPIEGYYRLHSRIYDATRWTFLFGRTRIIDEIAAVHPASILEVGCGTGRNLVNLARRFPRAAITGVDLSETMLGLARRKLAPFGARIRLLHRAYDAPLAASPGFDLVLFSYALSMFNPGFDTAITAAHRDVAPGGHIAVVDFQDTPLPLFARWMGVNHVRMEGHLRRLHPAYGGVWRYLIFVGRKDRAGVVNGSHPR